MCLLFINIIFFLVFGIYFMRQSQYFKLILFGNTLLFFSKYFENIELLVSFLKMK